MLYHYSLNNLITTKTYCFFPKLVILRISVLWYYRCSVFLSTITMHAAFLLLWAMTATGNYCQVRTVFSSKYQFCLLKLQIATALTGHLGKYALLFVF